MSLRADPSLLEKMAVLQRTCVILAGTVSLVFLAGWLIPSYGRILPAGWSLMKCNTALAGLFSSASLASSWTHRRQLSRALAILVVLLTLTSLAEYIAGASFHIGSLYLDTLLASDVDSPRPGRMAPQTGITFALIGVNVLLLGANTRRLARFADLLAFTLCVLVLFNISGNVFGAMHLFGLTMKTRTSPQTLVVLFLLTCVVFTIRAERGVFSVLFGEGIGSRIARVASPFALFLPLLLEMARGASIKAQLLSPEYATAIVASTAATLAFALILLLAWRINQLQSEISALSLRDDLTDLYNRRGFYLLAGQARRLAQRGGSSYSVLFIDLDNLKQINDRYGHDVGSEFLLELATRMKETFRDTDIIGRVGGDEFLVAGEWDAAEAQQLAKRLENAALRPQFGSELPAPLTFSWGHATAEGSSVEPLDNLISRADSAMYTLKRSRKLAAI
ncbi:diguanylate cyclase [Silvibacterium sp.]|uniref:GGDEF domain-containing protein n=1 Tax=Silvibacterium sp. TaxID=1964179 RepID=UPI0039E686AA